MSSDEPARLRAVTGDLSERVGDAVNRTVDSARDAGEKAADRARDAAGDAVDEARDALRAVVDRPEDRLAAQIAEVVLGVDGVADLEGRLLDEATSRLPGHRVPGVRLTDERCELHVAMYADVDLLATAAAVREAVAGLVPGAVDITVEDVVRRGSGGSGGSGSGDTAPTDPLVQAPAPA